METENTDYNKQSILSRMLNLAATVQGMNKPELSNPIVMLLIESLAEEIYHLSTEVDCLEARVLDRLSSMLISETGAVAFPAHSLLHVMPLEYRLKLTTTDAFALEQQEKERHRLSLFPVCNTPVYNGGIRYFIFDRYLYSMDRELTKTLITRRGTAGKEPDGARSFWIGLELDDHIDNIENLSFYLNLSEGNHSADNLKQLLHAGWKLCGQDVPVRKGLYSTEESLGNPALDLFRASDNACKVNREIKKLYDAHYVTIDRPLAVNALKEKFPAPLLSRFSEEVRTDFTESMLWFEVTCPSGFTGEMIRSVEIGINIIPVACKRLVDEVVQVNRHIPVIPLNTRNNESFLSVHSLSDSNGISYYDVPLSDSKERNYGIYAFRSGGYERFGRNDAEEFLANMTNLIDHEAASFLKRNSESNEEQTDLQEGISAMIRHLTRVVHAKREHAEVKNYLLVEQQRETEIYFLKYWTAGSLADEAVKENILPRPSPDLPANPDRVYLVRPLGGGKHTPTQHEKYNLYRNALAEHPLLVTPEDIRRFCLAEFSEIVERVEVGSGHKKNTESGAGFIKTTDVYLYMRKYGEHEMDTGIHGHIEQVLRDHSPATFSYRVILK